MNFGTNVPILCMDVVLFQMFVCYNQQFCCEAQLFFFFISNLVVDVY